MLSLDDCRATRGAGIRAAYGVVEENQEQDWSGL